WIKSSSSQNTNPNATRFSAFSNAGERLIARITGRKRMPADRMSAGTISAPRGDGSVGNRPSAIRRLTAVAANPIPVSYLTTGSAMHPSRGTIEPDLERVHTPFAIPGPRRDRRPRIGRIEGAQPGAVQPSLHRKHEAALGLRRDPLGNFRNG